MQKSIIYIIIVSFFAISFFSCEEEDKAVVPKVITASADSITNTTARVGGNVSSDGGMQITDRGIYWGTATKPETSGTKQQIGTSTGVFYHTLRGLVPGVKYYVKAYAINSKGTSYGEETFFTTQINMPTVTTSAVTELTPSTAKVGGEVTDDGGFEVSNRGIYWSTSANPRLTGLKVELGKGEGAFSYTLTDLELSVTYYVIAFATNIKGTSYGTEVSFTTTPKLATVYTSSASRVKAYSAYIGGTISSNGGSEVTERGVYWGTSANTETTGTKRGIGSGNGTFVDSIKTLTPGVKYYYKAYAINSLGTSYGAEVSFTTLGKAPEATILEESNITSSGVTLNCIVNGNDLNTTVIIEYGTTTSYGNNASAIGSPLSNKDTLTANITGLLPLTTYHYRVSAVNDLGTTHSADSTFRTVATGIQGSVSDNNGNQYNTIGIGYQEWMTENLKTTQFNDGTPIELVDKDTTWAKLSTAAYCWYNNDLVNKSTYGALYNWFAVNSTKLCPSGWHVPTDADYTKLINYIGGAMNAGGKLKETGLTHWNIPNTGATNEYKFNANPGGKRNENGIFDFVGTEGNWWSASNYSTLTASYLNLLFNSSISLQGYTNKKNGMSVRCVKN